jgi:UDP-N-acetylglucosamine 2-epimerase (non-hydrolysing)
VLGVPCLTLRPSTERPVTVTEGTNTVVGTDAAKILAAADEILQGERGEPRRPELWDGRAGERIAAVLAAELGAGTALARARAG